MSKNNKKVQKQENETVAASHKKANIAVIIVVSITALILIAIAVMCAVRVDPLDGLKRPERYELYDLGNSTPTYTNESAQSKIRNAMDDMDFSVMNAVLQWNWDYSYNFVRDVNGNKTTMSADAISAVSATSTEYMVELIYKPVKIEGGKIDYKTAQSLEVDGEKIYFDRVKILIGNTDGSVGEIRLYPYIYDRVHNKAAEGGETYSNYKITAVKVRANTTNAYAALASLAKTLSK
ncbi:MAG: hypothetical protein J1G01_01000 [Clostridiales bacterium]|nr:hypothetical protein [Clostridiales bacterium]